MNSEQNKIIVTKNHCAVDPEIGHILQFGENFRCVIEDIKKLSNDEFELTLRKYDF